MSGRTLLLGLVLSLFTVQHGQACSWLNQGPGLTIREGAGSAKAILIGSITNPRPLTEIYGETDFHIECVIRDHALVKGKAKLVIPRYLAEAKKKTQYVLFCDVAKGRLGPYRGISLKGPRSVEY